ncbi:MAG: D-alanyl-lipoteichoic acid acyltransferase DltB (MBOAT superfamily) [Saprospiraceae bacterium]|jgi:D-alanyl-lipoteichoic acid acyltransferase DltB (MBOAT superfamily)|tara:strand:+ start:1336 stop:2463 length:1128 start_codon:yes stop_codon:yes gene_type:complete
MEALINILTISIPVIALSWLLPERWQMIPTVVATALFLAWISPISLAILTFTTLSGYYTIKLYPSLTTAILVVIIQMTAIFLYFKLEYAVESSLLRNSILPLGISYYSFRQIHYAIEAYKQQLPKHTITDYISYLFFLPTILIGPINRFPPFLKDLKRRRWDSTLFSLGLERILYGLAKITIIGNWLLVFKLNNYIFSIQAEHPWLADYLRVVKYVGNAYVQFAGYSDVAIGLSMLLGFKITENFNFPFLASNIADFWRRWHISLSEWCRDYVFYPFLGISRNAVFSIMMSMLVLGAWHEISLRFLLWGGMHAVAISIWHKYEGSLAHQKISGFPNFQKGLGILITIHFVMFSFVLTMEDTIWESIELYKRLFFI